MNAQGKIRWLGRRVAAGCLAMGWVQVVALAQGTVAVSGEGAWVAAAMPPSAPAVTRFFPLAEVKRGLRGVAYTVFEGVNPEPMEVEILGVLKDALGPGQDMILARLHGVKPEYTGVVAGMSGSPVYIDGQLVGALSYRIGVFSKEPIAGITPIEYMLQVRDGSNGSSKGAEGQEQNAGVLRSAQDDKIISRDGTSANESTTVNDRGYSKGDAQASMQAMETPLMFGGFSQETVERFGGRFRAMGLTPVVGMGGSDATTAQPEPLVPGSAVSAILVRGDLSLSGTCTVTYVDPTRLLACGHPITQFGPVDMPMTKAYVLASLASPLNAFKIINTTATVGAFTEDRASAIMGRFGVSARMIPVVVEVVPPVALGTATSDKTAVQGKTFHFEVLDNRQLTPSAMLVSVYQALQGTNTSSAEMSYRMSGEIGVKGLPAVKMDGLMAQSEIAPAAINAALFLNDRFSRVYGNALEQPVVTGLQLRMEAIAERRTAVLESARLSRIEARAGDTLEVEVTLHPYQAEERQVRVQVKLPAKLSAGPMRVLVSDGATVDRLTMRPGGDRSLGLADTVAELNRMRANDRVYVTLLDHEAQAVLDGEALPGVPLSMANVLEPLRTAQKMQLTSESVVEAGSAETGYAVSGSQVLSLLVK